MNDQPPPVRDDGLQLSGNREFQSRFWTLQRFAWIGFGAIVLLSLAGFSGGGGYFSHQSLSVGDATAVMPRVSRWADADHLRVEVTGAGSTEIGFGTGFSDYFSIEQIQPRPDQSEVTPGGLKFRFTASGEGKKSIDFSVRASRPGWTTFDVSVNGAGKTVSALILP